MPPKRNRRSGVEDLWTDRHGKPTQIKKAIDEKAEKAKAEGRPKPSVPLRWRARYIDELGQEHTKRFKIKADAEKWLTTQSSAVETGTHVAPKDAIRTVDQWCEEWKLSYSGNRETTVELAGAHIKHIVAEFGPLPLQAIRPTRVKTWLAKLKKSGLSDSYVYTLHSRLSQILGDAVHDGILTRNPCSRKTSPGAPKQKVYVATTEQVWAIHDAMPEHLRSAVLLGAFAGLRPAEALALRVSDVDFVRGIVHPKIQTKIRRSDAGDRPLKTDSSDAPVPIPRELTLLLSALVKKFRGENLVCNLLGESIGRQVLEYHVRQIRKSIKDLPETFVFHDLRHYYASLLISEGADIKTVQARLRHGSAITTLRYYAHLWPDADESTRKAIGGVLKERLETPAYSLRTEASE